MRLGLVVRRLGTHGGTERYVHGFARFALGRGHDVTVWCQSVQDVPDGVRVAPLPGWSGRGRVGRLLATEAAVSRIPRTAQDRLLGFIRARNFDVMRAGGGCHAAAIQGRRWTMADAVELRVDARAVRSAGRVVVNSDMAGADLARHYGVDRARTRLIRNGVDLDRFRPRADARLPGRGPTAVFLGSGFARKGLETAIRAVARVPEMSLVVLGADRRTSHYARLGAHLGMGDRLYFVGAVAHPEEMLPAARALILPTRYDPSANACMEALACGVPVLTSARNGAAEVLPEPWMTIARPDDVDGFAAALERTLQTSGLAGACRAVAERWPAERSFASLLELATESAA